VSLRVSVAIGIVFFTAIGLVALGDRTAIHRRRHVSIALALAAAGIALQLAGRSTSASIALDWLPGIYLLAGYWLPAQLRRRAAPALQARLEAADRLLFEAGFARFVERAPRLLLEYLEAAYLGCYAIVPAGLAWMYFRGDPQEADPFWTAVLLAGLPCYTLVAWFETRPPRKVEATPPTHPRHLVVRRLNLAILDRASIGLNTFPSGHAAASFAAALSVGAVMPAAGVVLGLLALSIAVASVAGRYHYALDAACGALVALAAFAVSRLV
jgi:membrane-associated phospholipid phosphatase